MALSLGSGCLAGMPPLPGTAHHCYYLHHSTKPDKIALPCYLVAIEMRGEEYIFSCLQDLLLLLAFLYILRNGDSVVLMTMFNGG